MAHGLSCSVACGIFPDQGLNPCPPHWQADSYPLHHQGSPIYIYIFFLNLFIYLLIYGCVGSSLLHVGFSLVAGAGATLRCGARASHCGGLSCSGARALGTRASVVVARGLSSCGAQA